MKEFSDKRIHRKNKSAYAHKETKSSEKRNFEFDMVVQNVATKRRSTYRRA